jgi:PhnB protein
MDQIHEMYPYLMVRDAKAAIAFYQEAFGATESFRLVEPSGRIGHAELRLGPATLMVCDEFPEYGMAAPQGGGFNGCTIHLHVDNADAMAGRAAAAGAAVLMPPTDQFYGERSCRLRDPFGHTWLIGHSIEKVDPEEMQRRYTALMTSQA